MGTVTGFPSRKRLFSMEDPYFQHKKKESNGSMSPLRSSFRDRSLLEPFEKRMRTLASPITHNSWSHLQGKQHYRQIAPVLGYEDQVGTEVPIWNPLSRSFQGSQLRFVPHATLSPGTSAMAGIPHRHMWEAGNEQDRWRLKLQHSKELADLALDMVGRPRSEPKVKLGQTVSREQLYLDTKRELEDYKRVVEAVNSLHGATELPQSVEIMKRSSSNLQQGPSYLYNIQPTGASAPHFGRGSRQQEGSLQCGEKSTYREALGAQYKGPTSTDFYKSVAPVTSKVHVTDCENREGDTIDHKSTDAERGSIPPWRALWDNACNPAREAEQQSRDLEAERLTIGLQRLQLQRKEYGERRLIEKRKKLEKEREKQLVEAFVPLSKAAEEAVDRALQNCDRDESLVLHDVSNIEVTRAVIQCLLPGAWLNDEVINVYMELLKEREKREPKKFSNCHFFNTFFYNKLYKDKRSYDYKAVRRWTTQKKLGYSLIDCDKILVPIHQDIHWCLAVINMREKRFEYLDSLKGEDDNVLQVLARYIVDEAKDKRDQVLDVSKWERVFSDEIPEQLNGCDCGMFMLKYADFYSRGGPLCFKQAHMEYFRRRTVWEILQLKAT